MNRIASFFALSLLYFSCANENEEVNDLTPGQLRDYTSVIDKFNGTINPEDLYDYESQEVPSYITKDNTASNPINNEGATLGRVLFYDKALSVDNTISCASCHQQQNAFSDLLIQSEGVAGLTGRHSMRLVNTRFSDEFRFFWDERATSLEDQTTKPIQDHIEMGFSGEDGDPGIEDLTLKLAGEEYYRDLFYLAYGDEEITEVKMQMALAQFIRSIQSFDSRFDEGLSATGNINANFANFTEEENLGKQLFLTPPPNGGAGCQGCHRAPEFDIDPNSLNNGVLDVAGASGTDLTNTRSPSLRDIFNSNGQLNGPLMHNGDFTSLRQVIDHYNAIGPESDNAQLDPRLRGPGGFQNLNLSDTEKDAMIAFIKTLSGNEIYTAAQWSDPF